jgi:hypothetical protein
MQEGYQIIEIKNRVSDVLTQMSIKVSNVLTVLGQRCADSYHVTIKRAASWCCLGNDNLPLIQLYKNVMYIEIIKGFKIYEIIAYTKLIHAYYRVF